MQERVPSMRDQVTEGLLVERLRQRDESALGELSTVYGAKIFQLAFRYVKNRGDAALSSWIYRITFNTAMSRLRNTRAARMAEIADVPVGPTGEDMASGPR